MVAKEANANLRNDILIEMIDWVDKRAGVEIGSRGPDSLYTGSVMPIERLMVSNDTPRIDMIRPTNSTFPSKEILERHLDS